MTEHTMRLREEPFEKIRTGRKTIELRLYDEKRQQIAVGDTVRFIHSDDPLRSMTMRVTALHVFPDFAALYAALPMERCGYAAGEMASPDDMEAYYDKEEQSRHGVVGIEMERITEHETGLEI